MTPDETVLDVARAIMASVPDGVVGIQHARLYAEAALVRMAEIDVRMRNP